MQTDMRYSGDLASSWGRTFDTKDVERLERLDLEDYLDLLRGEWGWPEGGTIDEL